MLIRYPDIKPYQTHRLSVGDGHEIYLEQSGNAEGIPVLFVHGGPGAGCRLPDRSFFDPVRYRIILFDQRGAGRSTPHASLDANTTPALLQDMETIRGHLGIEQWLLFGGGWGAALSLVYAQTFPERVRGMVLHSIFLCREQDIAWFYQTGASLVFPDHWEDFLQPVPEQERGNLVEAYYRRLTGSNELAMMSCAKAWALWQAHCATLRPCMDELERFSDPHTALALARLEASYFRQRGYLQENQILNHAARLEDIPGIIVHGRYDMVCPLDNAQALHNVWHDSELHIVRDAGHAAREPGIVDALIRASRAMARRFAGDYPARA